MLPDVHPLRKRALGEIQKRSEDTGFALGASPIKPAINRIPVVPSLLDLKLAPVQGHHKKVKVFLDDLAEWLRIPFEADAHAEARGRRGAAAEPPMQQDVAVGHSQLFRGFDGCTQGPLGGTTRLDRVLHVQRRRKQSTRFLKESHRGMVGVQTKHLPLFALGDEHLDAMTGQFNRKLVRALTVHQKACLQHEPSHGSCVMLHAERHRMCRSRLADNVTGAKRNLARCGETFRPDQIRACQRPMLSRPVVVIHCELKHGQAGLVEMISRRNTRVTLYLYRVVMVDFRRWIRPRAGACRGRCSSTRQLATTVPP